MKLYEKILGEARMERSFKKDLEKFIERANRKLKKEVQSQDILTIIKKANNPRAIDDAMQKIDKMLEGFGVEGIREEDVFDRFWQDHGAIYSNMGDTYDETILYDTVEGIFMVTSFGDFIEDGERKGRNFI